MVDFTLGDIKAFCLRTFVLNAHLTFWNGAGKKPSQWTWMKHGTQEGGGEQKNINSSQVSGYKGLISVDVAWKLECIHLGTTSNALLQSRPTLPHQPWRGSSFSACLRRWGRASWAILFPGPIARIFEKEPPWCKLPTSPSSKSPRICTRKTVPTNSTYQQSRSSFQRYIESLWFRFISSVFLRGTILVPEIEQVHEIDMCPERSSEWSAQLPTSQRSHELF